MRKAHKRLKLLEIAKNNP